MILIILGDICFWFSGFCFGYSMLRMLRKTDRR